MSSELQASIAHTTIQYNQVLMKYSLFPTAPSCAQIWGQCLKDSAKILFPALRNRPGYQKSEAEEEFEMEMRERLRKVRLITF